MAHRKVGRRLSAVRTTGEALRLTLLQWSRSVRLAPNVVKCTVRKLRQPVMAQYPDGTVKPYTFSHVQRVGFKRLPRTYCTVEVPPERDAIKVFRNLARKLGVMVGRQCDQDYQPAYWAEWMTFHCWGANKVLDAKDNPVREGGLSTCPKYGSVCWFAISGEPDAVRKLAHSSTVRQVVMAMEGAVQHQGQGQGAKVVRKKPVPKVPPLHPDLVPLPPAGHMTRTELGLRANRGVERRWYSRIAIPLIGWVIVQHHAYRGAIKDEARVVRVLPFPAPSPKDVK